MKNPVEVLRSSAARTPFEKSVKQILLERYDEPDDTVSLEIPVSENNKDILVDFTSEHGIEVPEPQHKADYVEAIETWMEQNK